MQRRMIPLALLAALATAPAWAATQALLPAQDSDMVPATLTAHAALPTITAQAAKTVAMPQVHAERQPVSINWALPHDGAIQAVPQSFARSSREYWLDASADDLKQGLQLPLTAPGAIIRVSPSDTVHGQLAPEKVQLRLGNQSLSADRAASQLADATTMRAAGMNVPAASLVMRLKPELGSGVATLQAASPSGRYVVHVFEPNSSLTVSARADRDDALLGQHVHVSVGMQDAGKARPLQSVDGFLRAPDGSTTPLDYRAQADGSYAADVAPARASAVPGLWEIHSFSVGDDGAGHAVRRDTTTVFSAAAPDARLDGSAEVKRAAGQGIDVGVGVTAAGASRYAVSGVLYGRDSSGHMVPAAYAQSAAWLPAGNGKLVLHYDASNLHGVGAPYELHDLRLQDQPAIALIERRALALRFDAP